MMKTYLGLHKSDAHPTAGQPSYEEIAGRIKILENEIFDLRQQKEVLSKESELLKFRFRRRTWWLMKIIDQLNN